jgi:hypothetical protein
MTHYYREGAKNAKKAFRKTSRSSRLRGKNPGLLCKNFMG